MKKKRMNVKKKKKLICQMDFARVESIETLGCRSPVQYIFFTVNVYRFLNILDDILPHKYRHQIFKYLFYMFLILFFLFFFFSRHYVVILNDWYS